MIERAARLRRAFFPPAKVERLRRKTIQWMIVYPVPIEISRPPEAQVVYAAPVEIALSPRLDLQREAEAIAAAAGKRIRVIDILCATSDHFRIKKMALLSNRRARGLVRARQVIMYLSKEMTTRSLPEIGRLLGGKDHTTVLHGVRKIAALIAAGDPIAADVEAIRASLQA
jgi:hypothetical protein